MEMTTSLASDPVFSDVHILLTALVTAVVTTPRGGLEARACGVVDICGITMAAVTAEAAAATGLDTAEGESVVRRLRAELRRIHRRDYFPPVERDQAGAAVENLTAAADQPRVPS
jgi:hypothetical protein